MNKPEPISATKIREASLLYTLIAAKPASIGELVDYAKGIPADWVACTATAIALSVINDYRRSRRRNVVRRHLVILGVLLTRLAFEIESIPKDRSKII